MKIVLIDTNNFIEPFETSYKSVEVTRRDLQELSDQLDIENNLQLILPEIVELEVVRLYPEKKKEMTRHFEEVKNKFADKDGDLTEKLNTTIQSEKNSAITQLDENWKLLNDIFDHPNTTRVPLSVDIFLNSYKRGIKGLKPYDGKKVKFPSGMVSHETQPDCIILESLIYHLESQKIPKKEVTICTKDPHFYDEDKISPDISSGFDKIEIYRTLRELLRSEFKSSLPKITTRTPTSPQAKTTFTTTLIQVDDLISDLESSRSFDQARANMHNIMSIIDIISAKHLDKILKSMFTNSMGHSINQVLSVDNEQKFTKTLYMHFKKEVKIWKDFAGNIVLYYGDKDSYLESYNWLFQRLSMQTFDFSHDDVSVDDIPF